MASGREAGLSLLAFLRARGGLQEAEARAAIERGGAFVQGKRVRDPAATVSAGALVEVLLRERGALPETPQPLAPERLLHLDALVLAVDKPAGVLAQEGRAGGPDLPALVSALLASRGEAPQALLVHRLDRGTTGITVLARTQVAQAALLSEFREGRAVKRYLALASGAPAEDEFTIDLALGADPGAEGRRRVDAQGEPARTRFTVLRRYPGAALLAAHPETGRTHQIRVHLAARGLPLLGDVRYGGPRVLTAPGGARLELPRPLLHASALELRHPSGAALSLSAPDPADLRQAEEFLAAWS